MSPAQYVSVSLATCVGLCRFGEAWAALRAENLLTYLHSALCRPVPVPPVPVAGPGPGAGPGPPVRHGAVWPLRTEPRVMCLYTGSSGRVPVQEAQTPVLRPSASVSVSLLQQLRKRVHLPSVPRALCCRWTPCAVSSRAQAHAAADSAPCRGGPHAAHGRWRRTTIESRLVRKL